MHRNVRFAPDLEIRTSETNDSTEVTNRIFQVGSFRHRSIVSIEKFPNTPDGVEIGDVLSPGQLNHLLSVRKKFRAKSHIDSFWSSITVSKDEETISHERNAGEFTVIAFLNSSSGGGVGKRIFIDLVKILGENFVFDLKKCTHGNMPEDHLAHYALDPKARILACGGDGTMGWIQSAVDKVWQKIIGSDIHVENTTYRDHLPLAVMPLGTGNDLSRSFGWGKRYKSKMRGPKIIEKIKRACPTPFDRWRCVIIPFDSLNEECREAMPNILVGKIDEESVPAMLGKEKQTEEISIQCLKTVFTDSDDAYFGRRSSTDTSPGSVRTFDGVFCNYFSIGLDAMVAFSFHQEREEHPERFNSAMRNKMKYMKKGLCKDSFFAPTLSDKIKLLVANERGEMNEIAVPNDCRAIALMNIQSYAGGTKFTNKGRSDDGLIEIVFFTNIIRMATSAVLSPIMPFLRFRVAAQSSKVCIRINQPLHCQVDGEPWLQKEAIFQISHFGRSTILRRKKSSSNCADQSSVEHSSFSDGTHCSSSMESD